MRVEFVGDCWVWKAGANGNGYGRVAMGGRMEYPHRASYALFVGPLRPGLVIDHLCRNPLCVNPAHLEQVSERENIMRGVGPTARNGDKTHCKRGHPFDRENTHWDKKGRRTCRKCKAMHERERKRRLAALASSDQGGEP